MQGLRGLEQQGAGPAPWLPEVFPRHTLGCKPRCLILRLWGTLSGCSGLRRSKSPAANSSEEEATLLLSEGRGEQTRGAGRQSERH